MNRYVKVNIKRSYDGKIKRPAERWVEDSQLIDENRMLNEEMPMTSGVSFHYYFSQITGLKLKA